MIKMAMGVYDLTDIQSQPFNRCDDLPGISTGIHHHSLAGFSTTEYDTVDRQRANYHNLKYHK